MLREPLQKRVSFFRIRIRFSWDIVSSLLLLAQEERREIEAYKVFDFTDHSFRFRLLYQFPRMDLETENRIASVLLREAAELRRQAERDGVRAYLEKPNVRHRPNSRFLTATVLGVQQSNRAVETNEMWKAREKEIELENERRKRKSREESSSSSSSSRMKRSSSFSKRSLDKRCSSSNDEKKFTHPLDDEDEGLGDDEIESFLQSRNKRGRGSIGPRMDETGPYLPAEKVDELQSSDTRERKVVLGPERPPSLRQHSDDKEPGRRIKKDSTKKLSKKDKKTEKKRKRDKH
ncbi:BnaC03g35040D [Brassica napus]|uniref:BnaC03g35040D protein n=1 Tax=Brassica napus TaxID=3708 RepID=A0A078F4T3_BRANA|nr:BnaC03g35040D [Brassica napus]